MNFRKNSNGITLIALVITIIVMLILVGVTLSMIAGENGILGKAEKAVALTNDAATKEDIGLAIFEKMTEYYANYNDLAGRYPKAMDYVNAQFKDGIQTNSGATLKYNEVSGKFEYTKGGQMAEVDIDADGKVVSIGDTTKAPEKPVTPVAKYTVTYDANGGSGVPTDSQEYEKGATASVNFDTIPTRDGYSFLGWTDSESDKGTAKYTSSGTKTLTMSEKNVTLYAVWKFEFVQGGTWTQDKINVTNGPLTLEVGTKVSGYTANGVSDWYVLGAKDGKLLITTNSNVTTVTLSGQDGYANGIATLNTKAAPYTNSNYAEGNARTIDVDDMNRVTGYDPDVAKYNDGTSNVYQWGNGVNYVLNGNVWYCGSKYPTEPTESSFNSFTYWTGSAWKTLVSVEGKVLTHTYYNYYPQTLTTTSSSETKVNGSSQAYSLLFANTVGSSDKYYWIGSQFVSTAEGYACLGMRSVNEGRVYGDTLYATDGRPFSYIYGLRPVVSLQSDIKVSSDGSLSK